MTPRAVVIGPPGAGKTTVGALLAESWQVSLRDTDVDVEQSTGRSIADLFTTDGESVFRAMEEEAVAAAVAEHEGVVALGGGAVLSERTRAVLRAVPVVFLSVGLAEGARRTGLSTARPLLAGVNPRATFKALLDARMPLYREVATVEIDTDHRQPAEIVEAVRAALAPRGATTGE